VQPAVGDPASAVGLDKMIPRGPFQPLPFCDFVIYTLQLATAVYREAYANAFEETAIQYA